MFQEQDTSGPSHSKSAGTSHPVTERGPAPQIVDFSLQAHSSHPDLYEVHDETVDETAAEESSEINEGESDDEEAENIHTSRLRKPMLSLSNREKNDICR